MAKIREHKDANGEYHCDTGPALIKYDSRTRSIFSYWYTHGKMIFSLESQRNWTLMQRFYDDGGTDSLSSAEWRDENRCLYTLPVSLNPLKIFK